MFACLTDLHVDDKSLFRISRDKRSLGDWRCLTEWSENVKIKA